MEKRLDSRSKNLCSLEQKIDDATLLHGRTLRCFNRASMPDSVKFGDMPKKAIMLSEHEPARRSKALVGSSNPAGGFVVKIPK